ncbi:MAG: hypothetical protein KAW12_09730 [Candidatus Aminicenantes bacterium]|nr:hypothetical protein [Candidatus Aminicenantes bacterium]
MKKLACLLFMLVLLALGLSADEKKPAVDFSNPVKVVDAIFEAARNEDLTVLDQLCDPKGENDGDTRRICEMAKNPEMIEEFYEWFGKGKVTGAAVIEGDTAKVPFVFGPEAQHKEDMILVKREGKWYLSDF